MMKKACSFFIFAGVLGSLTPCQVLAEDTKKAIKPAIAPSKKLTPPKKNLEPKKVPESKKKKELESLKNAHKDKAQPPKKEDPHSQQAKSQKAEPSIAPTIPAISTAHSNGLPLPRFVCFKANAVNMHVGPGDNYPTEWHYIRQNLPVEVIAEFDHWRQVRDHQGTMGWVHKTLLSNKRFVVIQTKVANLYTSPDLESKLVATVEPGVVCRITECLNHMCKVDINGVKGWMKREFLWGIYPHEQSF